ncbi:MAG: Zn-ribbon domain-containing OB-fold protein [Desulfomonilaceae bacterium]
MNIIERPTELLTGTFEQAMPYEWSVGIYGSRFFQEIKRNKRFVGIRCPKCGRIYTPPRRLCGPCFEELTELVTLSDTGTLVAFTIVNYPFLDPNTGAQRPIPYTYGYIRLDGADSIFSHIINELDPSKIRLGMKVKAVFKDEKDMEGNVQDIKYFEPVD